MRHAWVQRVDEVVGGVLACRQRTEKAAVKKDGNSIFEIYL